MSGHLSGNQLRINTQESSESGNSANQINYCKTQIYSNLFPPHMKNMTPNSVSNSIYSNDE